MIYRFSNEITARSFAGRTRNMHPALIHGQWVVGTPGNLDRFEKEAK